MEKYFAQCFSTWNENPSNSLLVHYSPTKIPTFFYQNVFEWPWHLQVFKVKIWKCGLLRKIFSSLMPRSEIFLLSCQPSPLIARLNGKPLFSVSSSPTTVCRSMRISNSLAVMFFALSFSSSFSSWRQAIYRITIKYNPRKCSLISVNCIECKTVIIAFSTVLDTLE